MSNPNYREGLTPKTPDQMWIGNDITVPVNTVLPPGVSFVDICLPPGSEPPHDMVFDQLTEFSARSRLAQLGLHGTKIFRKRGFGDRGIMKLFNFGNSPIMLQAAQGIGCQFNPSGAELVHSTDLRDRVMANQGVQIDGKYGNDWAFFDFERTGGILIPENDTEGMKGAVGIALRLKNVRWQIRSGLEPIRIQSEVDYRKFLDTEILEAIGPEKPCKFWISETQSIVNIDKGYNGELYVMGHVGVRDFFQTRSTLMQGGNGRTSWPIRTEFVDFHDTGSTSQAYDTTFLLMSLYRDKRIKNINS